MLNVDEVIDDADVGTSVFVLDKGVKEVDKLARVLNVDD